MKKFIVILLLISVSLFIFGCKTTDFSNNISQLRYDILSGENDNFTLTCYLEIRETPYISDGEKGEVKNLIVLKLQPKNDIHGEFVAKFRTDKEYSKDFSFDSGFNCYVASVNIDQMPEKSLTVYVSTESATEEIALNSVKKSNLIGYEKAITSVYDKYPEKFDGTQNNSTFELNVRLMIDGGSFWFVSLTTQETTFCYLVDGSNGKIIAEKQINNM